MVGWEYLLVRYEADETVLADLIPSGVEPMPGGGIGFEWCRTLVRPTGKGRIDASVVLPCLYRGHAVGLQLRHYCDQLRPARLKAGVICDGGPDFYAKLLTSPQLRMGTLHDGETLVTAAILSSGATGSSLGQEQARRWLALPRVALAELDNQNWLACSDRQLTFERNGAVTFEQRAAPSGAFVAPAVNRLLYGQFFKASPDVHHRVNGSRGRERSLSHL